MTEYVFTLSDKTPSVEIDVKETAIAQGGGQDLYDRAKRELGFTGTFEEFLTKFKGERGADGLPGAKGDTGERGQDGENGKSAYEIAVVNGYVGNEEQWLASLKAVMVRPGEMVGTDYQPMNLPMVSCYLGR